MKERLKKFYHDHEETILVAAGCIITASFTAAVMLRHIEDGHTVKFAGVLDDGTERLHIVKRNGMQQLLKPSQPAE